MGINVEHRLDGFGHCSEGCRDDAPDFDLPHQLSEADLGIGLGDRKPLPRVIATLAADDGPGGLVQPATAGIHNFMGPFLSPSWELAPRAP